MKQHESIIHQTLLMEVWLGCVSLWVLLNQCCIPEVNLSHQCRKILGDTLGTLGAK